VSNFIKKNIMIQQLLKGMLILALPLMISCGGSESTGTNSEDIDAVQEGGMPEADAATDPSKADPVCGMEREAGWTDYTVYKNDTIKFCSEGCKMAFEARPEKYLSKK
jgi:YHS domain-containing protein